MAENLNYAGPNGDIGKYYDNDPANGEKYGRLYDWETAMKASPPGWHLPSKEEWEILMAFAGGEEIAGKKLKAKNGWNDYGGKNGNGKDEYGFSALPGGSGYSDGGFNNAGDYGRWWSATEYDSSYAWGRFMGYSFSLVYGGNLNKSGLLSVRCLQDKEKA